MILKRFNLFFIVFMIIMRLNFYQKFMIIVMQDLEMKMNIVIILTGRYMVYKELYQIVNFIKQKKMPLFHLKIDLLMSDMI